MEQVFKVGDNVDKFYSIFDLSLHFIFLKDINGKLFWVNNAIADIFGMSKDDIYKFYNEQNNKNEIYLKYIKDDNEVLTTKKPKYDIEEKIYGIKNDVWVNTVKIPIINSNGNITGLIGFSTNITKLRQTKLEFETIIKSIPETILIFDYYGNCLNMYPGKINLMPSKNVVGKNIEEMKLRAKNDVYEKFITAIENIKKNKNENQSFECTFENNNNEYHYDILMTSFNGSKLMVILRDITDKKKLDILESFNKSIKELMQYNQKILKTLGHESEK